MRTGWAREDTKAIAAFIERFGQRVTDCACVPFFRLIATGDYCFFVATRTEDIPLYMKKYEIIATGGAPRVGCTERAPALSAEVSHENIASNRRIQIL
jgi:hypothetical protein